MLDTEGGAEEGGGEKEYRGGMTFEAWCPALSSHATYFMPDTAVRETWFEAHPERRPKKRRRPSQEGGMGREGGSRSERLANEFQLLGRNTHQSGEDGGGEGGGGEQGRAGAGRGGAEKAHHLTADSTSGWKGSSIHDPSDEAYTAENVRSLVDRIAVFWPREKGERRHGPAGVLGLDNITPHAAVATSRRGGDACSVRERAASVRANGARVNHAVPGEGHSRLRFVVGHGHGHERGRLLVQAGIFIDGRSYAGSG